MRLLTVKENQFMQKKILKKVKNLQKTIFVKKDWRGEVRLPKYLELIIGKKSSKMIKADFPITWVDL